MSKCLYNSSKNLKYAYDKLQHFAVFLNFLIMTSDKCAGRLVFLKAAMQPVQPGTGPLTAKDVCQNTRKAKQQINSYWRNIKMNKLKHLH